MEAVAVTVMMDGYSRDTRHAGFRAERNMLVAQYQNLQNILFKGVLGWLATLSRHLISSIVDTLT